MTADFRPARGIVHCDDAPVSCPETMDEAARRLPAAVPAGEPSWSAAELARGALGEMSEDRRAELLTELLCDLRGPRARALLGIARNRITSRLHELITDEYDAEAARMAGQDIAELARGTV